MGGKPLGNRERERDEGVALCDDTRNSDSVSLKRKGSVHASDRQQAIHGACDAVTYTPGQARATLLRSMSGVGPQEGHLSNRVCKLRAPTSSNQCPACSKKASRVPAKDWDRSELCPPKCSTFPFVRRANHLKVLSIRTQPREGEVRSKADNTVSFGTRVTSFALNQQIRIPGQPCKSSNARRARWQDGRHVGWQPTLRCPNSRILESACVICSQEIRSLPEIELDQRSQPVLPTMQQGAVCRF